LRRAPSAGIKGGGKTQKGKVETALVGGSSKDRERSEGRRGKGVSRVNPSEFMSERSAVTGDAQRLSNLQ